MIEYTTGLSGKSLSKEIESIIVVLVFKSTYIYHINIKRELTKWAIGLLLLLLLQCEGMPKAVSARSELPRLFGLARRESVAISLQHQPPSFLHLSTYQLPRYSSQKYATVLVII